MKTVTDVEAWVARAADAYGDPSVPVCQLCFRWTPETQRFVVGDDALTCGLAEGAFALLLGPNVPAIPLPIRAGDAEVTEDEVITYGLDRLSAGVWAMTPSLNIEGFIHAFVVLYDVPDPAPWERRIVLAAS
jgi:hypothetical protein